jgi:hypothetical protein
VEAEPPTGGEAHTGLLDGVLPFLLLLFYTIFNILFLHPKYAAAKPPGAASRGPKPNIFTFALQRSRSVIYFIPSLTETAAAKPPRAASRGPDQNMYRFCGEAAQHY